MLRQNFSDQTINSCYVIQNCTHNKVFLNMKEANDILPPAWPKAIVLENF